MGCLIDPEAFSVMVRSQERFSTTTFLRCTPKVFLPKTGRTLSLEENSVPRSCQQVWVGGFTNNRLYRRKTEGQTGIKAEGTLPGNSLSLSDGAVPKIIIFDSEISFCEVRDLRFPSIDHRSPSVANHIYRDGKKIK